MLVIVVGEVDVAGGGVDVPPPPSLFRLVQQPLMPLRVTQFWGAGHYPSPSQHRLPLGAQPARAAGTAILIAGIS